MSLVASSTSYCQKSCEGYKTDVSNLDGVLPCPSDLPSMLLLEEKASNNERPWCDSSTFSQSTPLSKRTGKRMCLDDSSLPCLGFASHFRPTYSVSTWDMSSSYDEGTFYDNSECLEAENVESEKIEEKISTCSPCGSDFQIQNLENYVMEEINRTEEVYVLDLHSLCEGYLFRLRSADDDYIVKSDVEVLFGNVEAIYSFHRSLLESFSSDPLNPDHVVSCFLRCKEGFQLYNEYCINYPRSMSMLNTWLRDGRLSKILRNCQLCLGHVLPLGAYLLTPVQRVLKYHLLLQKLVQTKNSPVVNEALDLMRKVAQQINRVKERHERAVRVQEIENSLQGWSKAQLGSLSDYGQLVQEGSFRLCAVKSPRHLILLEKLLLITKRRGSDELVYKSHIKCSSLMLIERVPGEPLVFCVLPFDNPREKILVEGRSLSQKRLWCQELKRIMLESFKKDIPEAAKLILMNMDNASEGNGTGASRRYTSLHYLERRYRAQSTVKTADFGSRLAKFFAPSSVTISKSRISPPLPLVTSRSANNTFSSETKGFSKVRAKLRRAFDSSLEEKLRESEDFPDDWIEKNKNARECPQGDSFIKKLAARLSFVSSEVSDDDDSGYVTLKREDCTAVHDPEKNRNQSDSDMVRREDKFESISSNVFPAGVRRRSDSRKNSFNSSISFRRSHSAICLSENNFVSHKFNSTAIFDSVYRSFGSLSNLSRGLVLSTSDIERTIPFDIFLFRSMSNISSDLHFKDDSMFVPSNEMNSISPNSKLERKMSVIWKKREVSSNVCEKSSLDVAEVLPVISESSASNAKESCTVNASVNLALQDQKFVQKKSCGRINGTTQSFLALPLPKVDCKCANGKGGEKKKVVSKQRDALHSGTEFMQRIGEKMAEPSPNNVCGSLTLRRSDQTKQSHLKRESDFCDYSLDFSKLFLSSDDQCKSPDTNSIPSADVFPESELVDSVDMTDGDGWYEYQLALALDNLNAPNDSADGDWIVEYDLSESPTLQKNSAVRLQ